MKNRVSMSDIAMDVDEKLAEMGQYTEEERLEVQRECLKEAALTQQEAK